MWLKNIFYLNNSKISRDAPLSDVLRHLARCARIPSSASAAIPQAAVSPTPVRHPTPDVHRVSERMGPRVGGGATGALQRPSYRDCLAEQHRSELHVLQSVCTRDRRDILLEHRASELRDRNEQQFGKLRRGYDAAVQRAAPARQLPHVHERRLPVSVFERIGFHGPLRIPCTRHERRSGKEHHHGPPPQGDPRRGSSAPRHRQRKPSFHHRNVRSLLSRHGVAGEKKKLKNPRSEN